MRIRTLLIDWGGTLCAENLPPLSNLLRAERQRRFLTRFPEVSAAAAAVACDALENAARLAGTDNSDAPIQHCVQSLGLDLSAVRDCMHIPARAIVVPFPGAAELLADARTLGLSRVVVTNTAWHTRDTCQRDFVDLGLDVDDVVTSVDAGSRKPDAKIFETALRLAQSPAHEAIYVGNDELRDISPARAMGMRTIRVAIEEPMPDSSAADAMVASLGEARERLWRWVRG